MDFAVAGAFELFKDHVVHARPGIDQSGSDNSQRAAFLDVARRPKEALRTLERVGIDTTGKNLAAGRHDRVVSPSQTSNRIEQDDDVALVLNQTLGLFDH